MFKFDKKTSDTIKMANKYKSRIEKAEKIMNEISFPETFENRGKIKENLKLLSSTMNGIKSANTTLEKKITEINAIGKKNNSINNMELCSSNKLATFNSDYSEYITAFEFANKYIDWNKFNETLEKSDETDILKIIFDFIKGLFESEEDKKKGIARLLYNEYGISINYAWIEKISGKNGQTIKIALNDGTEITIYGEKTVGYKHGLRVRIAKDNQELIIGRFGEITYRDSQSEVSLSIILSELRPEDIVPVYDISEEEQKEIRKEFGLEESAPIKGYSVVTINGKETKVYWIGDDVSFADFQKNIKIVEEQVSNYPPNILDSVFNSGHFKGFVVGTHYSDNPSYKSENWGAYAHLDQYIYIYADSYSFNKESTVYHEFAHILDSTLYGGQGYYTEHEQEILGLYDEYRTIIQEIPELSCSGYTNKEMYPDGVPNVEEFFATIVQLYFSRPEELETLLPELYEYVDKLFKSI